MSNLNLLSPINLLSYGIVGRNICRELVKLGHNISLWPIGNIECEQDEISILQQAINNQSNYYVNAPCLRIYHQFALDQFVGKGNRIGWPIFELDKFNDRERHHLMYCDRLFVCSNWAKKIVENTLPEKWCRIDIVPLGVNREIFHENIPSKKDGNFVFLSIGKWELRKSHGELCEVFNKAFCSTDNVELWLMHHNFFLTDEEIKEWQNLFLNSPLGSKVKFIPPVKSSKEVAQIISHADCGISLSKAEGWDLPLLEMMSCGKQIITTNYSGHTEFCTKENSKLVEIQELEQAFDGKWFFGQGNWAVFGENQIEQTVELMRSFYKQGKGNVNFPGIETSKELTWENSAKKLLRYT